MWEELAVLSEKPNQENVPWNEYQQRLNQVTSIFELPIPCCDYSSQEMVTQAKYLISVYMYSGYCQVVT